MLQLYVCNFIICQEVKIYSLLQIYVSFKHNLPIQNSFVSSDNLDYSGICPITDYSSTCKFYDLCYKFLMDINTLYPYAVYWSNMSDNIVASLGESPTFKFTYNQSF